MDVPKAMAFIAQHGSDLERARASRIVGGVPPAPDVVRPFLELQNEDGGFPFGLARGNLTTVNDTLTTLWWLDELDLTASPVARRALDFLLATQRADGGWDEDPGVARYGLPAWIVPASLPTRLYLSAYAAYSLAVGGHGAHPALGRVLDFLAPHQDETGRLRGFLHNTWIATSVFCLAGSRYAARASAGLRALVATAFPEWADSQLAWALACLGRAGLARSQAFVAVALAELLRRQEPAGSWSSEDGPTHAVGATIAALRAFELFGLLSVVGTS